jgi:hypothetical protein
MSKKKEVKKQKEVVEKETLKQGEIAGTVTKTKLEELKETFLYCLNDTELQKEKHERAGKDLQAEMTDRNVPCIHTVKIDGTRIVIEITSEPSKDKLVVKKEKRIRGVL